MENKSLEEVKRMIETGIFFPSYTHVNANSSRSGIEKTRKLMAPMIAKAHDIIPFSGESLWYTYNFRSTHVSLSCYPTTTHPWRRYISYGLSGWTPERSEKLVDDYKKIMREHVDERKPGLIDIQKPDYRKDSSIQIEEVMELEEKRREAYSKMSPEEQNAIRQPHPDIYVFDRKVSEIFAKSVITDRGGISQHPFVPCEINLPRYLLGMFTTSDLPETKTWIENITQRETPVASIDSLDECEKILELMTRDTKTFIGAFYDKLRSEGQFRQDIISKVMNL